MGLGAEAPKGRAAGQVLLGIEGVVDGGVCGEEALSGRLGFEALHLSLSSPDGEMAVFSPIVLSQAARAVAVLQAQLLQS